MEVCETGLKQGVVPLSETEALRLSLVRNAYETMFAELWNDISELLLLETLNNFRFSELTQTLTIKLWRLKSLLPSSYFVPSRHWNHRQSLQKSSIAQRPLMTAEGLVSYTISSIRRDQTSIRSSLSFQWHFPVKGHGDEWGRNNRVRRSLCTFQWASCLS